MTMSSILVNFFEFFKKCGQIEREEIMKNLKLLRESQNLSQRECASQLDISKTTLCYYEQGKISPSVETIIKLADFFDCSIDYLLGHQTKDLIYASDLTTQQTKIINEIKQMTDDDLLILEGVIMRLNQEKQASWLKNI